MNQDTSTTIPVESKPMASNPTSINEVSTLSLKKENFQTLASFLIPFTINYLTNLSQPFKALSPFGLFSLVTILYSMVTNPSPSYKDIEMLLNWKEQNKMNFKVIETQLKKYYDCLRHGQVMTANFFLTSSFTLNQQSNELKQFLKQKEVSIFTQAKELDQHVEQLTQGLIQTLNLQSTDRVQYLINILTLQYEWLKSMEEAGIKSFYGTKSTQSLAFLRCEQPVAYVLKEGHFRAFRLDLKQKLNSNDSSSSSSNLTSDLLCVYFIDTLKDSQLTEDLLNQVHQSLVETTPKLIRLDFPRCELEEEITFSKSYYPGLLRSKNTDFPLIGSEVELEIKQKTRIQVSKLGIEATSITTVAFSRYCLMIEENTLEYFILDRPFYIGIMNPKNGLPLFLGHVTKGKDA